MKVFFREEEIANDEDCPVIMEAPYYRNYAMTLRKTRIRKYPPVKQDYVNHLAKLNSRGVMFPNIIFEEKPSLHLHGVAKIPDGFNIKLLRVRGWHLHLVEIYSEAGWDRYISKQTKKPQN